MFVVLKIFSLFGRTLRYYVISYVRPGELRTLKQLWGQKALNDLGFDIKVKGEPPVFDGKPLILVGNHISYLDILLLIACYPDIVFIAKKEVSRFPIIGPAARRAGTLFVNREHKGDREKARRELAGLLKKTQSQVVVFPSGTTTLDENKLWKKGAFEIAHEHSIPVHAFKISYNPLRESAYIDEDNLLQQMYRICRIKQKSAELTWVGGYEIKSPVEDAERIRMDVLKHRHI